MHIVNGQDTGGSGYSFGVANVQGQQLRVLLDVRHFLGGDFARAGSHLFAQSIVACDHGSIQHVQGEHYYVALGVTGEMVYLANE